MNPNDTTQIIQLTVGTTQYQLLVPHPESDHIGKQIAANQRPYEAVMLEDMALRLSDQDIVIDVGANIGNHTLYLAAVVGCRVIAFEPNEYLFGTLLASVELNNLRERVQARPVAIGDSSGYATFSDLQPDNVGAQQLQLGEGAIRIYALDDLTLPDGVRALKIDVEGMELSVLRGAQRLLREQKPLVYVECRVQSDYDAVWMLLSDLGYIYIDTFNYTATHLFIHNILIAQQPDIATTQRNVINEYYRLQRKANQLSRATVAAETQLAYAKDRLQQLELTIQTLQAELTAAQQQIRDQGVAWDNLDRDYHQLTTDHEVLVQQASDQQAVIAQLNATLATLHEQYQQQTTDYDQLKAAITIQQTEHTQEIERLTRNSEEWRSALAEQQAKAEEAIQRLRITLEQQQADHVTAVEQLKAAHADEVEQLDYALREQQVQADTTITRLQSMLDERQTRSQSQRAKQRAAFDAVIAQREQQIERLQAEVAVLTHSRNADWEHLRQMAQDQARAAKRHQSAIRRLEARLNQVEAERNTLRDSRFGRWFRDYQRFRQRFPLIVALIGGVLHSIRCLLTLRPHHCIRETLHRRRQINLLRESGLVDNAWYYRKYPDVAAAVIDPVVHYLDHGADEMRDPNPLFSTRWYVQTYPDVENAAINPLVHYLLHGADEQRNPSPNFDTRYYRTQSADGGGSGMNPLAHYLLHGKDEGQRAVPPQTGTKASEAARTSSHRAQSTGTKDIPIDVWVHKHVHQLYTYGFWGNIAEIEAAAHAMTATPKRRSAARECALWYMAKDTQADVQRALGHLEIALDGETDPIMIHKGMIMQAEGYARLNQTQQAHAILDTLEQGRKNTDVLLARANAEPALINKLRWLAEAMQLPAPDLTQLPADQLPFDQLALFNVYGKPLTLTAHDPTVTVIMPIYNAEATLATAIESVLAQTWHKLEIIVVDDASTDASARIAQQFVERDPRVTLSTNPVNAGTYVARNRGLEMATGDYVTVHDADDWSHPEKIAVQAAHLRDHPECIANFSNRVRASNQLDLRRVGKYGQYNLFNTSSLMFRRQLVNTILGYWDQVRFGADTEFIHRLWRVFGKAAVIKLETIPLSLQRLASSSLTMQTLSRYNGYAYGARKEYRRAYQAFHETATSSDLYYPPAPVKRPFAVPFTMTQHSEDIARTRRHFDVIIVSDFRFPGGTSFSNREEIRLNKAAGLKTGLVQLCHPTVSKRPFNPVIRELIDGETVEVIVYGEKVSCDLLIIKNPTVLAVEQGYRPEIEADEILVIVNQPPYEGYGDERILAYEIPTVLQNMGKYFGRTGTWIPISPQVREALQTHHAHELRGVPIGETDWVEIINVNDWKRATRPAHGGAPRIGRHANDRVVKWHTDPDVILQCYPDDPRYDVRILGGAKTAKKILGYIPDNWTVYPFNSITPRDYLAELDVFVYFTFPGHVEAFGRVIFEAMAVGVPVILPPIFAPLFGEAAIYAEPSAVLGIVDRLMADPTAYQEQIERARTYVEEHFGEAIHDDRIAYWRDRAKTDRS